MPKINASDVQWDAPAKINPADVQWGDGMPAARKPNFAETSPNLYKGLVAAREYAGPTVEALATAGGGVLGSSLGPFGTVGGAGLGYGISQELLNAADVGLGLKPPRTTYQTIRDPLQNVTEGAFFEGVAGPVIKGASKVFDIGKGATLKAKNILAESLGGMDIKAVQNKLLKSGDNVTAGQALSDDTLPAFQALSDRVSGRTVLSAKTKTSVQEAQEAARRVGIKDVTPDLADSIKMRDQISKPFYEIADKAIIKIDDELKTIFDRMPAGTLAKAAEIAKMEGRPFIMGTRKPAGAEPTGLLDAAGNQIMKPTPAEIPEITGESMHFIKRALSDIANAPPSLQGIGRDTQAAAKGVLNDFITGFETRVPAYGEGRKLFSEASGPVDQAKVLDAMMKILDQPGGGERVMAFLNVLGRGETALLKKSTGFPRYESGDLRKVLTPDQMKAVDDAASQMTRDIRISDQASTGREALFDVLSENMKMLRFPSLISFKVSLANEMLNKVEKKVGREVMNTLTESLQTAKTAEELLSKLPAHERLRVLNIIYDTAASSKLPQRAIRTGAKEAATQDEKNNPFAYAGSKASDLYNFSTDPINKLTPKYLDRNNLRP